MPQDSFDIPQVEIKNSIFHEYDNLSDAEQALLDVLDSLGIRDHDLDDLGLTQANLNTIRRLQSRTHYSTTLHRWVS